MESVSKTADSLRSATGAELSRVNQIYINLLSAIESLSKKHYLSASDEAAIAKLIENIHAGKTQEDEFPKAVFGNNDLKNDLLKCLQHANEQYADYCTDQFNAFNEILNTYNEYLKNGSGVRGYFSRFKNGYSYHGSHTSTQKNFIKLIDRLALIDSEGNWIGSLLDKLNEFNQNNFNLANQAAFFECFYAFFDTCQKQYFDNRAAQDTAFKLKLINTYNIQDVHQNWLEDYYDHIVYGIKVDLVMPADEGFPLGKITHDIKVIKDNIEEENDSFNQQIKLLKKDIHHTAHELGLPLQIKKHTPNEEDPYQPRYYIETNREKCKTLISPEAQKKRQLKALNKNIAFVNAITSSAGEGAVAVAGFILAFSFLPLLGVIFLIGASGWFINRLLFNNDIRDCLDVIFIKKTVIVNGKPEEHRLIFLDKNDQPVSKGKKRLIKVLGLFTLSTGFVFGALNFMSTLSLVGTSSQLGLMILIGIGAAIPAIGVTIGLTSIFFKVIADFIKNDRRKQIASYIHKTFFDVPWKEMTADEKWKHVGKCALQTVICLTAVFVTVVVTVASFGVLYQDSLKLLNYIANANPMKYVAKVATWVNSIISLPFQIEGTNKVFQKVVSEKQTFANLKENKGNTTKTSLKEEKGSASEEANLLDDRNNTSDRASDSNLIENISDAPKKMNKLQNEARNLSRVEIGMALMTATLNGAGQAGLFKADETYMTKDKAASQGITGVSTFLYSGVPNTNAGINANDETQVKPQACGTPVKLAEVKGEVSEAKNSQKFQEGPWRFFTSPVKTTALVQDSKQALAPRC